MINTDLTRLLLVRNANITATFNNTYYANASANIEIDGYKALGVVGYSCQYADFICSQLALNYPTNTILEGHVSKLDTQRYTGDITIYAVILYVKNI